MGGQPWDAGEGGGPPGRPVGVPAAGRELRPAGGRWRLLGTVANAPPWDGPTNMAVDQALLASVAAGAPPVLRLYRWSRPTLSFGRNQPARGLYDEAAAADRGIDFVRRPTGGQAVLHDAELTYAVVASVVAIGKPRAAYHRINAALVTGLRSLGLPASLASPGSGGEADAVASGSARDGEDGAAAGRDWSAACFRRPERGEVIVGERKLVGSAQRVEARTILQHGSILLGGSQAVAEELLTGGRPPAAGAPGWTTLESELGRRLSPGRVASAIAAGFAAALGLALEPGGLSADEVAESARLRGRFGSREWTWRR